MDSTHFEYTVSSDLHEASPFNAAELTCAEVVRRKILLETTSLSLPEQTFVHQTCGFIPLYTHETTVGYSLNCAGISQIMTHLGDYGCSTILREIHEAITSTVSVGREVTEVKIWKIKTKVYKIDIDSEKLLIEKYCSDSPAKKSLPVFGYNNNNPKGSTGCVICMEDYREGSIVAKLPCDHDFHGVCINKWSQIKHLCPLCRFPFSHSSSFSFYFWIFVL